MQTDLAKEMEGVMDAWRASGESLKSFSRTSEHSYTKLCYWRRRLHGASRRRTTTKTSPTMVPVSLINESKAASSFEVSASNGVSITVPEGFNSEELQRLIEVVRSC